MIQETTILIHKYVLLPESLETRQTAKKTIVLNVKWLQNVEYTISGYISSFRCSCSAILRFTTSKSTKIA